MSSSPLFIEQPASLTLSSPALTLLSSSGGTEVQPTSQSIWHACQTGDLPYIRLFLASLPTLPSSAHSATSELNSLNSLYESPVHVAASYNQLAALQLLLSAQPPPHVSLQDRESGWTALHCACYRGHLACAAALVQSGVDVTVLDHEGSTAFDLLLTRERPAHFLRIPRRASSDDSDSDDDRPTSRSRASYHCRRLGYEQRQLGAWRGRLSHQLYTFGSNRNYQLGLPSDASQHDKPRHIQSLATDNVTTVTCTRLASFALSHGSGALWAWGQGGSGRLGSGLEGSEVMPRRIVTGKVRVVDIDADERYACAVGERGEVVVWGQAEWLGREREMRRERERDKEERKEREDTLRAMKPMTARERTEYQGQKDAERREREERDRERREERERDKRQQQADCTFLTPTRLESCRHLTVTAVSCSAQRLFLLTKAGELWYLGHALDDVGVTCVPKRVGAMSELAVREVHSTARAVVVVTREGEVYQQVKGERKCYRVMFRFSTFSTFSTATASASTTVITSTYSPTLSPSSPPFSPPLPSSSTSSSTRRRPSAYPRIVKLSMSVSAERCMALTSNGECYWWKIHQDEATVVSASNSPPLPSIALAGSHSFPPFYLSPAPPTSSSSASTSASSSGGRKVAHLVPGISHLRVVDIALGNGHTTVVTDLGDVWHWGKTPLLSHYGSRPQRVNYLHQAVRVWCSDQHVICSTVYHTPPLQTEVETSEVATLRSMCETQLARHISFSSLLPAVSFAISLSLPSMFRYALYWLLCNFNILVHPAMKRLSVDDWAVIQQYYSGVNDGDEDEAVLRRAGGAHGSAGSRSIAHFGLVGEGEERHIGFYTARDDEGEVDDEDLAGESDDSDEDDESRQERTSKDGIVNLLAVKQWEKGGEQRRQAREERRRKRRIEEKEAELRERKREEEERWREGLTDAEIVQRLKNQLRALRKKQRRREERKAEGEEDEAERRQLWVAGERIKGELRAMSEAGCVEARVVLMEGDGERSCVASVEERKEDDQHNAADATPSLPLASTSLLPASSFESPSYHNNASSPTQRDTAKQERNGKRGSPDKPRAGKLAAAAAKPEVPASTEAMETDKSKAEAKGWGRSLVTAVTPTSASSASPFSLFASIQREQEQATVAAPPRKVAVSKPAAITPLFTATPPSTASPPSTPASRPFSSNPWGKPTTPPSLVSSFQQPSTASVTASAPLARVMSLAEIQQEEEHKQRRARVATRQQPARSVSSAGTSLFTTPPTASTPSPPLSSTPAPFMLQLADYIPTPVATSSLASRTPQRGWNVSSSTSPPLPSLSLRSIQQEEAVLLPSSALARGGVGAASVSPKSVVWGRADVMRVGAVVAVSGVREVQEEEERAREEERLRRQLEEVAEREQAEMKRSKKEARKLREAERKAQKQRRQAQEQQPVIVAVTQEADSAVVNGVVHTNGALVRGRPGGGRRGGGGGRGRGGRGSVERGAAATAATSAPSAISVYDVLGVSKPPADLEAGTSQPHSQHLKARSGRGGGRQGYGGVDTGGAERDQRRGRGRGHGEWIVKRPGGLDERKDVTVVSATQQQA